MPSTGLRSPSLLRHQYWCGKLVGVKSSDYLPIKYWHLNGARADKGTGIEPENVWPPERYLGTYGDWNGAWADVGTRRVPGHLWALEGCQEHIGNKRASGNIWTLERCPDTYRKQKVSWIHIGTSRVPRHIWVL